jgi:hypothetical protein
MMPPPLFYYVRVACDSRISVARGLSQNGRIRW